MFVASAVLFLGFLLPTPPTRLPWNFPRAVPPQLCDAPIFTLDPIRSAELEKAQPSPALQAREVIDTMMTALHRGNIDRPRTRFGCEVAMRFLAPTNPASKVSSSTFASYLEQTWYQPLLTWSEYRWEGDLTLLGESEAYQQLSVRADADGSWTSVRWILRRVPYRDPAATADQWMVEAVFVSEPDGPEPVLRLSGQANSVRAPATAPRETGSPGDVVLTVMRALRQRDVPYPYHGCEVAIRYCSPTNKASRLSPQAFAQYLNEPWYKVLTEWDHIELEDEPEATGDGSTVSQDVLVKREGDDTWTVVNWQLARYSGRWLMDALSITE